MTESIPVASTARHSWTMLPLTAVFLAVAALMVVCPPQAQAEVMHSGAPLAIGGPGHGAGQMDLAEPGGYVLGSGVAVNELTGDVYVADTENHRIDEFSESGAFIRAFGADVGGPGVDVCTTTCVAGAGASSEPGAFRGPRVVAVDNSTGPSAGDVYVADIDSVETRAPDPNTVISKFDEDGNLISSWGEGGQIKGFGKFYFPSEHEFRFHAIKGMAVDPGGDLLVLEGLGTGERGQTLPGAVREFDQAGSETGATQVEFEPFGLGAGPGGMLYSAQTEEAKYGLLHFTPLQSSPVRLARVQSQPSEAVDVSTGALYALESGIEASGAIDHFAANCTANCIPLEIFGLGTYTQGSGIAVDGATGTVYAVDFGGSRLLAFAGQTVEPAPSATIEAPSGVEYSRAHVAGTVDPNGHPSTCQFEYVAQEEFEASGFVDAKALPCATAPGSGSAPVAVSAELVGLRPDQTYRVRLAAQSAGGLTYSAEPSPTLTTEAVTAPTVHIVEPVADVSGRTARFSATIDPNAPGPAPQDPAFDVAWTFECRPGCPGLSGTIAADDTSHQVEVEATGLEPGMSYEVSLVAENAGGASTRAVAGPVHFQTEAVAPQVDRTFVTAVGETVATLNAQVDPGGASTTAFFEYVTAAEFAQGGFDGAVVTPESPPIGSDDADHLVSTEVAGLSPGTGYVYRVVAKNTVLTVPGPFAELVTFSPGSPAGSCVNEALRAENGSLGLPDCRAFERVSSSENAPVYQQSYFEGPIGGIVKTPLAMASSPAGASVAYVAAGTMVPGEGTGNTGLGFGDQWLATRGSGGWSTRDISPPDSGSGTYFEGFSPDLGTGLLDAEAGERPLAPEVESKCRILYSRTASDGDLRPLFTGEATPCHPPFFVGSSADGSALLFESAAAKTSNAKKATGEGHENIYISHGGGPLHLVNVSPAGKADPGATVGALTAEPALFGDVGSHPPAIDTEGALSEDGSVVFWTDLSSGIVYARENPSAEEEGCGSPQPADRSCTEQVSTGAATYEAASADGRLVYYTEGGSLWQFDTQTGAQEDLAPGAGVIGVIGLNRTGEDGNDVYLVAEGSLAPGAEARACSTSGESPGETREEELGQLPPGRGCNLYVLQKGEPRFIAALAPGDDNFGPSTESGTTVGDWRGVVGYRTAQVSADGSHVTFMSERRLTTYDNVDYATGCNNGGSQAHACAEIYVASAGGSVACASCRPDGQSPEGTNNNGRGTFLPPNYFSILTAHHFFADDGARVFFSTEEPLVPGDHNSTMDVYEWEQSGKGSCTVGSPVDGGGCVRLVSGGEAGSNSSLVDASQSGNDVFFVTRSALVPGDRDEKPDLYDSRVDGGFAPTATGASCESVGACRGSSTQPPSLASPTSQSFAPSSSAPPPARCKKPKGKKPKAKQAKCGKQKKTKKKKKKQKTGGGSGKGNARSGSDHGRKGGSAK